MSINNLNTYLNVRDAHLRVVSGNVYAQAMNIGGINVETAHGLQSVSDTGNVTSNTLQFSNATTGFVTTANAQIGRDLVVTGNATVSTDLTVSANATVTDTLTVSEHLIASKEATVTGNLHVTTIRSDSNVVAEYTGPHDRPLRKYPEVYLTAATTGGYTASQSSENDTTGNFSAWKAFDSSEAPNGTLAITQSSQYNNTSGTLVYAGDKDLLGDSNYKGEWIKLELPISIAVKKIHLQPRTTFFDQTPCNFKIVGSNDNSSWDVLYHNNTAANSTISSDAEQVHHMTHNLTKYYKYVALVANTTGAPISGNYMTMSVTNLEFYGHEEGSGSLDTTLKTVYNVPATTGTQLEVYYDAKDLTTMPSTVTDLSPITNNATLGGNPQVSNGAFVFDGSGDAVISGATSFSGSPTLSYSVWFKTNSILSGTRSNSIVMIGHAASGKSLGFRIKGTGDTNPGNYRFYVYGGATNESVETDIKAHIGIWTHATIVRDGLNMKLYIDGKFADENTNTTTNLALASGAKVALGNYINVDGDVTIINTNDSYDGSIANFRLYSKALNADQVKELYDYQKDYFLGSKSKVTLYKGHLGVGVTEPSGQLELAGDERLQEYPPGPMNDYDTHIPGHGVFTAIASSNYTYVNGAYNAFDKQHPTGTNGWASMFGSGATNDTYDGESHGIRTDGALPTGRDKLEGISGSWIGLKMPYDVKVTKIYWYPRFNNDGLNRRRETIQDGIIWGSKDGTNWVQLRQLSGVTYQEYALGGTYSNDDPFVFDINNKNYYDRYVIQLTKLGENTSGVGAEFATCQEIKFFGTPGPTTLDKGSLTLGRSLDVPRVSRYDVDTETPRPEKIVLDYDTTVNSSATDISGKGNHATFKGNSDYSPADKAFKFDGQGASYIKGSSLSGLPTGNAIYSLVGWINVKPSLSVTATVIVYGSAWGVSTIANLSVSTSYQVQGGIGGDHIKSTNAVITPNTWHHVAAVKKTSTGACNVDTIDLYVDGVLITDKTYVGISRTQNIGSTTYVGVGGGFTGAASDACDGLISNPKIYSVALEPSEVRKLYNLGRTGRSMVISDTAVGIGKVPEAQLDVRGNLNVDGVITNQQRPAFYVWRDDTSGATEETNTTGVITNWDSKRVDTAGTFDLSNGRYYIPVSGLYMLIGAGLYRYGGSGNAILELSFYVNGSNVNVRGLSYSRGNTSAEHHTVTINFMRYMNAGDYVQMGVHTVQSACDLYYGDGLGYFSGYLLG